MRDRAIIALAVAAIFLGSHAALGAAIERVEFPDRYRWSGEQLQLHGMGLLRYRIFIKGYAAALYLGERVEPERALDESLREQLLAER